MLEFIGALFLTVVALYIVGACLYIPLMSIGFAGWKHNWISLVIGVVIACLVSFGWWVLVGSNIHVGFG